MRISFTKITAGFLTVTFTVSVIVVSGCGPLDGATSSTNQLYSLDGVKLISQSVISGNDPGAYGQTHYELSPTARLLLRFEGLESHASDIDTSAGKTVQIQVALNHEPDPATPLSLRICPLTRTWMMFATWEYGHPYSGGKWDKSGGDIDESGCVPGVRNGTEPTVLFDVTRWFIDYTRGRATYYGQILIADAPADIVGETSGSYSPRILFSQFPGRKVP